MICAPFSRRGPSPAAEARSSRAQGGSRTRQGRSEAEDGEAVARARRPAQDSANSRGDLRRGRIDPGNHRGQAVELKLASPTPELGYATFEKGRHQSGRGAGRGREGQKG